MDVRTGALGKVRVFGPFELRGANGDAIRLAARSASVLVSYLALHPRGKPRAEVAETLWPEGEPEQARAALRTAVRRVRLALGESSIVDEEGRLRLSLESDSERAAAFRRSRRHAADAVSALAAAKSEWEIVQHNLLDGWTDEWIEPLRDDARLLANECGTALARLLEEQHEPEEALAILGGILSAVPHHTEALEHAMRLENALHGRERALAWAAEARRSLPRHEGFTLPDSIRRLERAIRDDACGFLPPPPTFADGQDLSLIGHMFERNLRRGASAALSTLAEEAFSPICLRHPYKTLDLLRKAISLTEGTSADRMSVVTAAVQYAMYANDDRAIHSLCDELIASFPPANPLHNGSLTVKGGAYLNVRDFGRARRYMELAIEGCTTEERRQVAFAQLAFLEFHEMKFDESIRRLEASRDSIRESARDNRDRNLASVLSGFCELYIVRGEWSKAIENGNAALDFVTVATPPAASVLAPLGLALICEGRVPEGVMRLRVALTETHRERMFQTHAFALDIAVVALATMGDGALAELVLDAANAGRRRIGFPRSPAERYLLSEVGGVDPEMVAPGPLRLQSPGSLADWLGETLERVGQNPRESRK